MAETDTKGMVSVAWLAAHIDDPDLRIVDATWHFGGDRKGIDDHHEARIPGAIFWDLDTVVDPESTLPQAVPPAEVFAEHMTGMGIGNDTQVIVYDAIGIYSAARVWWMLRHFGHDRVAVLEGGRPAWTAAGQGVESGPPPAPPKPAAPFVAKPRHDLLATYEDVLETVEKRHVQVVDARARARTAAGRVPGSVTLPFGEILTEDKRFVPADEIGRAFAGTGVDLERPLIVSCGSGVTASILALGLHQIGRDDVAVYDGSWSEWSRKPDAPIEKDE